MLMNDATMSARGPVGACFLVSGNAASWSF